MCIMAPIITPISNGKDLLRLGQSIKDEQDQKYYLQTCKRQINEDIWDEQMDLHKMKYFYQKGWGVSYKKIEMEQCLVSNSEMFVQSQYGDIWISYKSSCK